jgi:cell division protein FtsW (lipid II flippase)
LTGLAIPAAWRPGTSEWISETQGMPLLADPVLCWCLFAIQLVGLVSMVLARMPETSSLHAFCRTCFLACLVVVGLATIAATIDCHSSSWAWCATIFSVMAVGATADLGPARAPGF